MSNSIYEEKHVCKFCGNKVEYDKKHCRYPKFCSENCLKQYNDFGVQYFTPKYCKICGKLATYNKKLKRWNETCGSSECLYQSHLDAQTTAVKNRNKIIITKEELYDLFINQNMTRSEVAKYYNCSEANIKKWLGIYNIAKDQKEALKNTSKTKEDRYGDPYFTNIKKGQETNIKKYGVKTNLQLLTIESYKAISKKESSWLDDLKVPERQYIIENEDIRIKVDGFDKETNTVYEFLGDYWHGNPNVYKSTDVNKRNNKTMGELYNQTIERFNILKNKGYKIIYRWESDDFDREYQ